MLQYCVMEFYYKKKFGQHFLRQVPKEILFPLEELEKIQSLQVTTNVTIIEIGPGNGVITQEVCKQLLPFSKLNIDYRMIEIDEEAVVATQHRLSELELPKRFKFTYINSDVLEVKIDKLHKTDFIYIFGALPYNISKKIVNWCIKEISQFSTSLTVLSTNFILQKEVAEDYCSVAPKNSLIGTAVSLYTKQRRITRNLASGAFTPPPKVESSILKLQWDKITPKSYEENEKLMKLIKLGFSKKRKMVSGTVGKLIKKENITPTLKHLLTLRASELSIGEWKLINLAALS